MKQLAIFHSDSCIRLLYIFTWTSSQLLYPVRLCTWVKTNVSLATKFSRILHNLMQVIEKYFSWFPLKMGSSINILVAMALLLLTKFRAYRKCEQTHSSFVRVPTGNTSKLRYQQTFSQPSPPTPITAKKIFSVYFLICF